MIYEELSENFVKLSVSTNGKSITFKRSEIDQLVDMIKDYKSNDLSFSYIKNDLNKTKHKLEIISSESNKILRNNNKIIIDSCYFPIEMMINPQTGNPISIEKLLVRSKRTTLNSQTIYSEEIKILLISSKAAGNLDFDDECLFRSILNISNKLPARIVITRLKNCVYDDIVTHLKDETFHIIHFNVHGDFLDIQAQKDGMTSSKFSNVTMEDNYFLFFRDDDCIRLVSPFEIIRLVKTCPKQPSLVIFNSCNSASYQQALGTNFVEYFFSEIGVSTLGMQSLASVKMVLHFFSSFYNSILKGLTLTDSILIGRKNAFSKIESNSEWWVPVLYSEEDWIIKSDAICNNINISNFVGRSNEVIDIEKRILENKEILIYGEPGVGKTTLAKYMLNYFRIQGYNILYVDFRNTLKDIDQIFKTVNDLDFLIVLDHLDECDEKYLTIINEIVGNLIDSYFNTKIIYLSNYRNVFCQADVFDNILDTRNKNVINMFDNILDKYNQNIKKGLARENLVRYVDNLDSTQPRNGVSYYNLRGLSLIDIDKYVNAIDINCEITAFENDILRYSYHGNPAKIKDHILRYQRNRDGLYEEKDQHFYLSLSTVEKRCLLEILQFENSIPDGHLWLYCKVAKGSSVEFNEDDFRKVLSYLKKSHFISDFQTDEAIFLGFTLINTRSLRISFERYYSEKDLLEAQSNHTRFYRSLSRFYIDVVWSQGTKGIKEATRLANDVASYELGNCLKSAIRSIESFGSFVYQLMFVSYYLERKLLFYDLRWRLSPIIEQCKKVVKTTKHVEFAKEFLSIADVYCRCLIKLGVSTKELAMEMHSIIEVIESSKMPSSEDLAYFVYKFLNAEVSIDERLCFVEKYICKIDIHQEYGTYLFLEYIDILIEKGEYSKSLKYINKYSNSENRALNQKLNNRTFAIELFLDKSKMQYFLTSYITDCENKIEKIPSKIIQFIYKFLLKNNPDQAETIFKYQSNLTGYSYFIQNSLVLTAKGEFLQAQEHAMLAIKAAKNDPQQKHTACMMLGHALFMGEKYDLSLAWYLKAERLIDFNLTHLDDIIGCKEMVVYLQIYFLKTYEAENKFMELITLSIKKRNAKVFAMLIYPIFMFLLGMSNDVNGFIRNVYITMEEEPHLRDAMLEASQNLKTSNISVLEVCRKFLKTQLLKIA